MFSNNLNEWFEGYPNLDRIELDESVFGDIVKSMEIGKEDNFEKTHVGGDLGIDGSEPDFDGSKPIVSGSVPVEVKLEIEEPKTEDFDGLKPSVRGSEPVSDEPGFTVKVEEELKPEGNVSLPIEEVIGRVSLVDGIENENSSSDSESESENETSSSSSSSSSSSESSSDEEEEEDEEDKEKLVNDLEEGEIMGNNEEIAVDGSSDDDDDDNEEDVTGEILSALDIDLDEIDDEDGAGAAKGPIKSKNEVEVLPEVPPLNVELQPHHQMLPVGVVLSMLGTKVIVEGREQHNPLNEGSVLWITTDRSPLGYVDEIFGPVKNPYYVVRYNSESEVPAGIHEGEAISFVREFADHVLNDKSVHKKGYDASGENDEELTDDGEFSDDEKEAKYKRMQKMTKRGMNDQRVGNRKSNKKKNNSRNGAWKNDRNSAQQTSTAAGQHPPNTQSQHNFSTVSPSLVNHNCSSAVVGEQNFVSGPGFVPPFSGMPQSSGFIRPSNGVWPNGMPGQHPQNTIFPNGMLLQNQQQPFPLQNPAMSMPTMMPYQQQQQFNPSLGTFPNMMLPGGQSSLFAGTGSAPWLGMAGQNGFNQSALGMVMQSQLFQNALQGFLTNTPNGPTVDENCNLQPNGVQGNFESSQNFNMGPSSGRGRKPFHRGRGRGRFSGGRGHQRS